MNLDVNLCVVHRLHRHMTCLDHLPFPVVQEQSVVPIILDTLFEWIWEI